MLCVCCEVSLKFPSTVVTRIRMASDAASQYSDSSRSCRSMLALQPLAVKPDLCVLGAGSRSASDMVATTRAAVAPVLTYAAALPASKRDPARPSALAHLPSSYVSSGATAAPALVRPRVHTAHLAPLQGAQLRACGVQALRERRVAALQVRAGAARKVPQRRRAGSALRSRAACCGASQRG